MFVGAMLGTIVLPVQVLSMIPLLFVRDESNTEFFKPKYVFTRYGFTFLALLAICVGELILVTVMWGTFPLEVDSQNYIRLRMIPFFPWPARDFLVFQ